MNPRQGPRARFKAPSQSFTRQHPFLSVFIGGLGGILCGMLSFVALKKDSPVAPLPAELVQPRQLAPSQIPASTAASQARLDHKAARRALATL